MKFQDVLIGDKFNFDGGLFLKSSEHHAEVLRSVTENLGYNVCPTAVGETTPFGCNTEVKPTWQQVPPLADCKQVLPVAEDVPFTINFAKDGDQWAATHFDFVNLHDSPAGFGDTPALALMNLQGAAQIVDNYNAKVVQRISDGKYLRVKFNADIGAGSFTVALEEFVDNIAHARVINGLPLQLRTKYRQGDEYKHVPVTVIETKSVMVISK